MVTSEMIPDDQLKSLSPVLEMPAEGMELRLDDAGPFEMPAGTEMPAANDGPAANVLNPRDDLGLAPIEEQLPPALVEVMEEPAPGGHLSPIAEAGDGLRGDSPEAVAAPARDAVLRLDLRRDLTRLAMNRLENSVFPPPVEMPLAETRTIPTSELTERTPLQVHAPIEIHIQVDGHSADSAEELREELLSVVPKAVHSAIEQLALQMGAV